MKRAKDSGDKKEGFRQWDKVKYDHQIVAIAKVEGVSELISMDEDIHKHGKLWGIKVLNVSDLPLPAKQEELPFEKSETAGPAEATASTAPEPESATNEPTKTRSR